MLLFLVTPWLAGAVPPCIEGIPIKKRNMTRAIVAFFHVHPVIDFLFLIASFTTLSATKSMQANSTAMLQLSLKLYSCKNNTLCEHT